MESTAMWPCTHEKSWFVAMGMGDLVHQVSCNWLRRNPERQLSHCYASGVSVRERLAQAQLSESHRELLSKVEPPTRLQPFARQEFRDMVAEIARPRSNGQPMGNAVLDTLLKFMPNPSIGDPPPEVSWYQDGLHRSALQVIAVLMTASGYWERQMDSIALRHFGVVPDVSKLGIDPAHPLPETEEAIRERQRQLDVFLCHEPLSRRLRRSVPDMLFGVAFPNVALWHARVDEYIAGNLPFSAVKSPF